MPALSRQDPLFGLIYYILGGWFIGSSAVLLLEGILISQISNYYTWCSEDPFALKVGVTVLFLLTVVKTIQSLQVATTWINNILYMRDPAGAVSLNREWYQIVNIPLGAVIAAYVQSYYCYRLWKLSEKWWYVAPLVTVMVLGLGSAIVTASVIAKTGKSSNWFAIHVSCTFATDVLITGASTYFLVKAREQALSRTRKLLSNLIKISCQIALPATTATLIELICSQIGGKSLKPQASNSIILVLLDAVPIIYACVFAVYKFKISIPSDVIRNCMLYILNVRRSLRDAEFASTSFTTSSADHPSGSCSRGQGHPGGAVEMPSLGGVQILTQTETAGTNYVNQLHLPPSWVSDSELSLEL
ncbi:hypothetical protein C8F04DRAFT_1327185 [Mycena alexandri]|uniref:Transmembrane protein n=1 Tax=Mycena alexandri TaxID=1745969 RepID=A0AAD6RZR3_9AGAR|nr:hypothetical protein C8F04DRAFT_1327185 [Mycena alexandri]